MSKGRSFTATAADGSKTKCYEREGWILMTATLTSNKPRSEDELKRIAAMGDVANHDFAHVTQSGNRMRVILRHHSRRPGIAETAAKENP